MPAFVGLDWADVPIKSAARLPRARGNEQSKLATIARAAYVGPRAARAFFQREIAVALEQTKGPWCTR